ncbi:MAG TPA: endonuclease/exonuclease/phosphatase family protein [Anaerolineales bacterium]|nr:endonuclease/exonuclease/phosphatase family protein [Anaerolineales bacterium]
MSESLGKPLGSGGIRPVVKFLAVREIIRGWTIAIIWAYFAILCSWLAAYLITGDRIAVVAALNMLAVYLFFPLPLVILVAVFLRNRGVWSGAVLAATAFIWFWGGLFLPRLARPSSDPRAPLPLSVMTYNVLGAHDFTSPIIDTIRGEDPDLVLLQELNPTLAGALKDELGAEYPYQVLNPQVGVSGMGVISKVPVRPSGESLPLEWVGQPQILDLDWMGRTVKLVHFHMVPTTSTDPQAISATTQLRGAEARAISDFAGQFDGPIITAGDANTTPLTGAHRIFTRELVDAWQEAGFGLGHTFPGSDIPGSWRPRLFGWPAPMWLARIDFLFHSADWEALSARLAKFDGVSDHRGVVAVLALK